MQGSITLQLHQHKGDPNTIRIFFNDDFLDEFDTSHEKTTYQYEIDSEIGQLNSFIIQVVGSKTRVDESQNILSSNAVIIDDLIFSYDGITETNIHKSLHFVREVDPVYQIYAGQKNIKYKKVNLSQDTSIGNGKFLYSFLLMKRKKDLGQDKLRIYDDPLLIDWYGRSENHDKEYPLLIENGQTIKKKLKFWDYDKEKFTISHDELTRHMTERFTVLDDSGGNFFKDQDLLENLKINIMKAIRFYEN